MVGPRRRDREAPHKSGRCPNGSSRFSEIGFGAGVHVMLYTAGRARCAAVRSAFGLAFCAAIDYIFHWKGQWLDRSTLTNVA
jgi:hypothetical protein